MGEMRGIYLTFTSLNLILAIRAYTVTRQPALNLTYVDKYPIPHRKRNLDTLGHRLIYPQT